MNSQSFPSLTIITTPAILKIMLGEGCSSQSCVNCGMLLKRACPLIEFILLQYKMLLQLSYDGSLSDEGRRLARESAEVLKGLLMRRGIFLTC